MPEPAYPPLIRALCNPVLHGGSAVRVVETHISWVLLAGETAYKIKKPVDFGFLDFSTLASRQRFCLEEVRLNRRLAPALYLGVTAITGDSERPCFDGAGEALEYAVKLKRFDEAALADKLLAAGQLAAAHIDGLAATLAAFHGEAGRSTARDSHGLPETILSTAEHSFGHLRRALPGWQSRLDALQQWTETEFARLAAVFRERKDAGFIRECHGDLHCGNLVLIEGRLVPFDCIEFNEDLRWIDVSSEIAFVFMDLEVRGRPDLAWRLLNGYLHITGDYQGLQTLGFYRVYRALVRAKIAALSLEQTADAGDAHRLQSQACLYLDYAEQAVLPRTPRLLITHGVSGSGKSHFAKRLAERLPAIRIASDIERKRLAGFSALQRTASGPSIYTEDFSRQTYALLLSHAECLSRAGCNVILDAAYLKAADRKACRELAVRLGVTFFILDFHVAEAVLRERITGRLASGNDPSEAGLEVLTAQMAGAEALESQERPFVVALDAEPDMDGVLPVVRESSDEAIE